MDDRTRQGFRHFALYGQTAPAGQAFSGLIPKVSPSIRPSGCAWIIISRSGSAIPATTGSSSSTATSRPLSRSSPAPRGGSPKSAARKNFHLPFHACLHPAQDRIYITDMGNGRVVAMDYGPGGSASPSRLATGPETAARR